MRTDKGGLCCATLYPLSWLSVLVGFGEGTGVFEEFHQPGSGAGAQPFLQRLQSFGPVRGLAAGQYGEVSPDVHSLVQVCAESIANCWWQGVMGRRFGGPVGWLG